MPAYLIKPNNNCSFLPHVTFYVHFSYKYYLLI